MPGMFASFCVSHVTLFREDNWVMVLFHLLSEHSSLLLYLFIVCRSKYHEWCLCDFAVHAAMLTLYLAAVVS